VTHCDEAGVDLEGDRIEASTIVWAAGVVASPAGEWVGAEQDRARRIKVNPDLTIPGMADIFVIGDTASVVDQAGRPVPGIAPAAKQMGRYVAQVIEARVKGRKHPAPFHYRHHGDLATIGRKAAVVKLDHVHLKGFVGWVFWSIAHVYFLIGLRNRAVVAFSWMWNYLTYQRGARLIVDGPDDQKAARDEKSALSRTAVEVTRPPEESARSGSDWG
jgi:NADH dehydrogenase